jgi:G3E family GTPase
MSSRPGQALNWSQAGGSLKADSAGVWWCSMPFAKRAQHLSFIENQKTIESDWDITFGDRKNEIVFIGQDMDQDQIKSDLKFCLLTDEELDRNSWKLGHEDKWPVPRAYAL